MSHAFEVESDALLALVACGELAPDAPEVQDRAAADPAFAEALEQHARVLAALAAAREAERAELARLPREVTEADRALARELSAPHAARLTRRRFARLVGGAGAVAALGLLFARLAADGDEAGDPSGPRLLGGDACRAPRGAARSFARFELDAALAPGETLELVVRDADGLELARSPALTALEWAPPPAVVDALEAAGVIEWTAVRTSAAGEPELVGGPCRAWLER